MNKPNEVDRYLKAGIEVEKDTWFKLKALVNNKGLKLRFVITLAISEWLERNEEIRKEP